jgi:class 3 adenylate cyclase/tetratricopeptide (TPR) repeat protein/energy-coupling factor transporter ATP-binding protein EcfA2
MSCPHCQAAALSNAKFCRQCGRQVGNNCPACGAANPPGSKFCGECGKALDPEKSPPSALSERCREPQKTFIVSEGERRHLTILFTDLTGYTSLMEKHDPEDVQALMTSITRNCIRIIENYNGHVERILGDEILGLFGLPVTHEDDVIRAIKAAREIHATVAGMHPPASLLKETIAMHTGINTGLVVTARSSPKNGTFDLSGDAVNLASRLSDMARPDEILVGPETYRQAFGFFDFDTMPAMEIKGKSHPISIYTVKGEKDNPVLHQRKVNLNAVFIGRQSELNQLLRAVTNLENGRGAIITLVGEAGAGKSRLLQEFEACLSTKKVNRITGYAFAHTQQVPYFPLVHLVRRWLGLDGSATEEEMSTGIARRVGALLGPNAEEIPIIQGLIGLDVRETDNMSPEEWRKRLQFAMLNLLSAIAHKAPTIFCMEDIHWSDSASYTLLKDIIFNFQTPAIVICTFRPHFSLFTSHELKVIAPIYKEIRIGELSPSETEDMMASMLDTDALSEDLCQLIRNRTEGNPFYLEEILNALVESDTLVFEKGRWRLKRTFRETDIPSTVHGVIASRMDQLSPQDKRILQEAAVIGRAFLYDILKEISVYSDVVDDGLYRLERAGLIRPRSLHPELEFIFKHALIQEVSYGSLLRSERQRVHERIGLTMEHIFKDRLPEFDETLAIHFQKSTATIKATEYLIRSGTKALRRCALDESDQYFKQAKSMLEQQLATPETKNQLLDVINQWAFVFYYRGLNRELLELLKHQLPLVEGLKDPVREGFHWAWHGCALWHRHEFSKSYQSLIRARELGEKADHPELIGYACSWLSWPCTELGRFDEAIENCNRAEALYVDGLVKDAYIYFHPLMGKGYAYWHKGDARRTGEMGDRMFKFGHRHGNVRSLVGGYCCKGWQNMITGDIPRAIETFRQAIQTSADPWYSQFPKLALCLAAISIGQVEEALPLLDQMIAFSDSNGTEFVGEPARFFKALAATLEGRVTEGLETMAQLLERWKASGSRLRSNICGLVLANAYSQLHFKVSQGREAPAAPNESVWAEKAIQQLQFVIDEAADMGSVALHGRAMAGLGKVLASLGRREQAQQALVRGIELLEQVNATEYLSQARQDFAAL